MAEACWPLGHGVLARMTATMPVMPATSSPATRRTAAGRSAGPSTPTALRRWKWSSSRKTSS
eukprot:13211617-Alexandrium_andersonii.AAC.1